MGLFRTSPLDPFYGLYFPLHHQSTPTCVDDSQLLLGWARQAHKLIGRMDRLMASWDYAKPPAPEPQSPRHRSRTEVEPSKTERANSANHCDAVRTSSGWGASGGGGGASSGCGVSGGGGGGSSSSEPVYLHGPATQHAVVPIHAMVRATKPTG